MKMIFAKQVSGALDKNSVFEDLPFLQKIQIYAQSPKSVDKAIEELMFANLREYSPEGLLEFAINRSVCNLKAFVHFEHNVDKSTELYYLTVSIGNFKNMLDLAENLEIEIPQKYLCMLYFAYGVRAKLYARYPEKQEKQLMDIEMKKKLKSQYKNLRAMARTEILTAKLYSRADKAR